MATAAHARLSLLLRKAWYSSESRATGPGSLGRTPPCDGGGGVGLGWSSISTNTTSAGEEEDGGEGAEAEASWMKRWKAHSEALRLIWEEVLAPETGIGGGGQKWSEISSTENTLSISYRIVSYVSFPLILCDAMGMEGGTQLHKRRGPGHIGQNENSTIPGPGHSIFSFLSTSNSTPIHQSPCNQPLAFY